MGVYLSQPKLDKDSKECENELLKCAASSMQGWRVSQEDAHNAILEFDKEIAMFGVYDGHGGHEVAEYTAKHLPDFIKNSEAYKKGDYERALRESFLGFDATLKTDAVLAILKQIADEAKNKDKLSVGNVDAEDDEDERDETARLREEANMPLDQVIAKYATLVNSAKTPRNKVLAGASKPMSPFLRAVRSSSNEDEKVSSSCNSSKSLSNGFSESNGEVKVENEVDSPGNSKANDEKSAIASSSDNGPVEEQVVSSSSQNGETSAPKQEQPDSSSPVSSGGSKARRCKKISETTTAGLLAGSASGDDDEEEDEEDSENDESFRTNFVASSDSEDEGANDDDDDEDEDEEEDDEDDDEDEDEEYGCGIDLTHEDEEPGKDSGCTAVVALVTKDRLIVANAGDSRAVLCRDGVAVDLSVDHKPEDAVELKRIEKAGGTVSSEGRVNGGLNLSRALGDHLYKKAEGLDDTEQMITALPDIQSETIDRNKDEFVVLACDGIWNSASSQQVVDFVRERLVKGLSLATICEQLFDECLAPDTVGDGTGCDNMTCVIVQFKPLNGSDSMKRPREEEVQVTQDDAAGEKGNESNLDNEPAIKKQKSDQDES